MKEVIIFSADRDPEITQNMAIAMERLCTSLRLPDGELTEEIVAVKIIEVVKEGLRDPGAIYERVLSDWHCRSGRRALAPIRLMVAAKIPNSSQLYLLRAPADCDH